MLCLEYLIARSIFLGQKVEIDFTTLHKPLIERRILK
jgi:hypothetical protein